MKVAQLELDKPEHVVEVHPWEVDALVVEVLHDLDNAWVQEALLDVGPCSEMEVVVHTDEMDNRDTHMVVVDALRHMEHSTYDGDQ